MGGVEVLVSVYIGAIYTKYGLWDGCTVGILKLSKWKPHSPFVRPQNKKHKQESILSPMRNRVRRPWDPHGSGRMASPCAPNRSKTREAPFFFQQVYLAGFAFLYII